MGKTSVYLLFILLMISGLLASFAFDNSLICLYVTLAICIIIFIYNRLSPVQPVVWFIFFINVYHLSIGILHALNIKYVENIDDIIYVNTYSIVGFLLSSLFFIKKREVFYYKYKIAFSSSAIKFLIFILVILSLYVPFDFIRSGASNKADFTNSYGSLYNILIFVFALYILSYESIGRVKLSLIIFSLYMLFSTLLLGERNIFFSYSIMLLIVCYARFGLSKKYIILCAIALITLIPILGIYKNVFTRSDFSTGNDFGFLISLANGEFRSAGFNLDVILSNPINLKLGASVINDIIRAIIPGIVFMSENSISWYNNTYHPDIVAVGRGYGFSFAAEGFINFSWVGVVIWFFCLGLFINFLNKKASESLVMLAIYSVMIPVFIYALRGDISTILSPFIKQFISVIILLMLMNVFFVSKKRSYVKNNN